MHFDIACLVDSRNLQRIYKREAHSKVIPFPIKHLQCFATDPFSDLSTDITRELKMNASENSGIAIVDRGLREVGVPSRDHTDIVQSHVAAQLNVDGIALVPCTNHGCCRAAKRRMRREIILMIRGRVEEGRPVCLTDVTAGG